MTAQELLNQKQITEHYLGKTKNRLSAFAFVNIFCWRDFFDFDFKVINGNLCIFARSSMGCFLYLPPLGEFIGRDTIDQCFALMREINGEAGVTRIENVREDQLAFFPRNSFSVYLKSHDFCYYKNDIAAFKGQGYKSKRSSVNQFKANYEYRYAPYFPSMAEECLALYDDWVVNRHEKYADDIYRQMLEDNRQVHQLIFKYFKDLGVVGRVVFVNNKIKAYTFGVQIDEDMFCSLCEITDLKIAGLAAYIFQEFCRDPALEQYKFMNVMDDFELMNIKKTKMSFRPTLLFSSYVVTNANAKNKVTPAGDAKGGLPPRAT